MTDKVPIPSPTMDQKIRLKAKFEESFGKSYNKMQKEQLALMILNQTANINQTNNEILKGYHLYAAMKRQRDWFHKLCREKNGK
jgi:hypothetical protein